MAEVCATLNVHVPEGAWIVRARINEDKAAFLSRVKAEGLRINLSQRQKSADLGLCPFDYASLTCPLERQAKQTGN